MFLEQTPPQVRVAEPKTVISSEKARRQNVAICSELNSIITYIKDPEIYVDTTTNTTSIRIYSLIAKINDIIIAFQSNDNIYDTTQPVAEFTIPDTGTYYVGIKYVFENDPTAQENAVIYISSTQNYGFDFLTISNYQITEKFLSWHEKTELVLDCIRKDIPDKFVGPLYNDTNAGYAFYFDNSTNFNKHISFKMGLGNLSISSNAVFKNGEPEYAYGIGYGAAYISLYSDLVDGKIQLTTAEKGDAGTALTGLCRLTLDSATKTISIDYGDFAVNTSVNKEMKFKISSGTAIAIDPDVSYSKAITVNDGINDFNIVSNDIGGVKTVDGGSARISIKTETTSTDTISSAASLDVMPYGTAGTQNTSRYNLALEYINSSATHYGFSDTGIIETNVNSIVTTNSDFKLVDSIGRWIKIDTNQVLYGTDYTYDNEDLTFGIPVLRTTYKYCHSGAYNSTASDAFYELGTVDSGTTADLKFSLFINNNECNGNVFVDTVNNVIYITMDCIGYNYVTPSDIFAYDPNTYKLYLVIPPANTIYIRELISDGHVKFTAPYKELKDKLVILDATTISGLVRVTNPEQKEYTSYLNPATAGPITLTNVNIAGSYRIIVGLIINTGITSTTTAYDNKIYVDVSTDNGATFVNYKTLDLGNYTTSQTMSVEFFVNFLSRYNAIRVSSTYGTGVQNHLHYLVVRKVNMMF